MYSDKAIKHFKDPEYAGELNDADSVAEEGNIKCGDVMRVYLKVEDNIIKDIKFKTYGCIAAIASTDALCKLAKGKTLDEALKITHQNIIDELGELPPIKHHCSVLGITALKKAIEQYKDNKGDNMVDENTTLGKILDIEGAEKVLGQNGVPCVTCPMAKLELDKLTLKDICKYYNLNKEKIFDELNQLKK